LEGAAAVCDAGHQAQIPHFCAWRSGAENRTPEGLQDFSMMMAVCVKGRLSLEDLVIAVIAISLLSWNKEFIVKSRLVCGSVSARIMKVADCSSAVYSACVHGEAYTLVHIKTKS
jgi:hypothetical protein